MAKASSFHTFLGKETNLWEINRTNKIYVEKLQLVRNPKENLGCGSKLVEVTKFIYIAF